GSGWREVEVAGGRAGTVPRLRGGDLPRPLVPGPGGDPHSELGGHGGESCGLVLVRGELRGIRAAEDRTTRSGGGAATPRDVPQADPGVTGMGQSMIADCDGGGRGATRYAWSGLAEGFRLEARPRRWWNRPCCCVGGRPSWRSCWPIGR